MQKIKTGLLHYSAPPVVGGVEAVIRSQANAFLAAGYPVRVIAGRGERAALPPGAGLSLIPTLDSQHAEIVAIGKALEQGRVPEAYPRMVQRIERELRPMVEDLDCLIVHNVLTKHFNLPLTEALFHLLEVGAIRRLVGWCHDFTWTSAHSRPLVHEGTPWDLLRHAWEGVDYVVVSRQRQKTLAGLFGCPPERIRVIYNGVDWSTLSGISTEGAQLIERLGLLDAGLVVLMPVRVTQAKNVEYALEVAARLAEIVEEPRLVLSGPPDPHDPQSMAYYHSLQDLRLRLGAQEVMRFVYESGPAPGAPYLIDERVVGDLFRVCDVVFMPSHREGFGMPVLEAGLAGVPVVCTAVPAAQEIAAAEVVIFEAGQPAVDTARLIANLVAENPVSRLRRRIRREYTWRAIFERQIEPLLRG